MLAFTGHCSYLCNVDIVMSIYIYLIYMEFLTRMENVSPCNNECWVGQPGEHRALI